MLEKAHEMKAELRDWLEKHADGRNAQAWLAAISFSESSFFPIPTAFFLVAIIVAGAKRWVLHASIATIFSVLGGVFGYVIGFFFFDIVGSKIIEFYGLTAGVEEVRLLYAGSVFLVVFTGAFTPLPYKVFTLSAGFLGVHFWTFLAASALGRALHFYAIAYIVHVFGKNIARVVFKYFTAITFALVALILFVLLF